MEEKIEANIIHKAMAALSIFFGYVLSLPVSVPIVVAVESAYMIFTSFTVAAGVVGNVGSWASKHGQVVYKLVVNTLNLDESFNTSNALLLISIGSIVAALGIAKIAGANPEFKDIVGSAVFLVAAFFSGIGWVATREDDLKASIKKKNKEKEKVKSNGRRNRS